jgi:hypothetical protein
MSPLFASCCPSNTCELHEKTAGTAFAKGSLMVRKMNTQRELGGDSESPAATRLFYGMRRVAAFQTR